MNQLIREDINIVGQLSKTLVYSYDSQNNITSIKTYGYQTISGTPLSEKKMYYQNTWKDQLTRVEYYTNGTLSYYETMTYDNSGNIIFIQDSRTYYNDKTFQWDGRQLTNYGSYCNSLTFKYNDQGIRTQKIQSTCGGNVTTNYVLDGDKVLVETRSNGITIYYTYDVDGSLLSMNYNGTEYFYITNLQGDVIELRDMSGSVVVEYKYDAWGNIVYQFGDTLADINPYRYRGYRFDVETGYYYLQSRYYNPQIGRFISADGLVGETGNLLTQNMYAYSFNNPVMYSDPSGKFAISALIIGVVVGMIIGAGTSVVTQAASNDWDFTNINYGLVINDAIFGGISGALAVSGLGMLGSAFTGGLLNGFQLLIESAITGQQINSTEAWISMGLGFAGGFIPSGFNARNLSGIWRTSATKLATAQSAKKIAMYQAKQVLVKSTIIKGTIGYIASTIGSSAISYGLDWLGAY